MSIYLLGFNERSFLLINYYYSLTSHRLYGENSVNVFARIPPRGANSEFTREQQEQGSGLITSN